MGRRCRCSAGLMKRGNLSYRPPVVVVFPPALETGAGGKKERKKKGRTGARLSVGNCRFVANRPGYANIHMTSEWARLGKIAPKLGFYRYSTTSTVETKNKSSTLPSHSPARQMNKINLGNSSSSANINRSRRTQKFQSKKKGVQAL
jgi:hypothetical protein